MLSSSLLALLAASGCMADTSSSVQSYVVHGTPAPEQSAVVAIVSADGALCSGTLVADRALLTAKHCVFIRRPDGTFEPVSADSFRVLPEPDVASGDSEATATVVNVHHPPGSDIDTDVLGGQDVAVLALDHPIGSSMLAISPEAPSVGDHVTLIGYGRSVSGTVPDAGAGVRRSGTTVVSDVNASSFETRGDVWGCSGDSGGPAVDADGRVTGVISAGERNCTETTTYVTSVAAHRDWLEPLVASLNEPAPDPEGPARGGCAVAAGWPHERQPLSAPVLALALLARHRRRDGA